MTTIANPNATVSSAVTQKTLAATGGSAVGGAVGTIAVYLINYFLLPSDHPLPDGVAGAVTTLISAFLAFISGYYIPHGADEAVLRTPDGRIVSGRTVG